MPKATGTLGNCYRVSCDGLVHGYFATESKAENYVKWWIAEYRAYYHNFVIKKWFIEGEF